MAKSDFYVVINGEEISKEMNDVEAAEFIFDLVESNSQISFLLESSTQHGRGEVTTIRCVDQTSGEIEILQCRDCKALVISVDGNRTPTYSVAGRCHGASKCSGAWTIQGTTDKAKAEATRRKP